jgi:hypothetical protein
MVASTRVSSATEYKRGIRPAVGFRHAQDVGGRPREDARLRVLPLRPRTRGQRDAVTFVVYWVGT